MICLLYNISNNILRRKTPFYFNVSQTYVRAIFCASDNFNSKHCDICLCKRSAGQSVHRYSLSFLLLSNIMKISLPTLSSLRIHTHTVQSVGSAFRACLVETQYVQRCFTANKLLVIGKSKYANES